MSEPMQDRASLQTMPAIAAHRWSDRQVRGVLEKLPAGAYMCDASGLITYYNERAVEIWGRAPMLNHPDDHFCGSFKLFSVDGRPILHERCWIALALADDQPYNGEEIVVERPDGHRLTVLAYSNPVHDEAGTLLGGVNLLFDVTDRKRSEEALREADRSKNDFVATLAHELRNPLAPVRNAAQILSLQGPRTAEVSWALEVIDRQMGQMTRLIDDLMDVSRITRNKLELRKRRIDLTEVVRSAVETSRPLLEAQRHELSIDLPRQPILLDADVTRLAQALSNLLNNAAKYTPPGGQVRIHVEHRDGEAVVVVSDTGVGIRRDMLPHVFEMFTQVRGSEGTSHGGLGIGLTLVRRLVEMHGGTVEAESAGPGQGSVFTLRLPALGEVGLELTEPVEQEEATATTKRILVVDDNRDSATSLGMLLQMVGNEVRTAYDGVEALEVAEELRPDVVLLDIGMPRIDGYEVARRIRRRPWGEDVVLVAITGWGQEDDRRQSQEAGIDHHLVKPVDPPALMKLLASIVK